MTLTEARLDRRRVLAEEHRLDYDLQLREARCSADDWSRPGIAYTAAVAAIQAHVNSIERAEFNSLPKEPRPQTHVNLKIELVQRLLDGCTDVIQGEGSRPASQELLDDIATVQKLVSAAAQRKVPSSVPRKRAGIRSA